MKGNNMNENEFLLGFITAMSLCLLVFFLCEVHTDLTSYKDRKRREELLRISELEGEERMKAIEEYHKKYIRTKQ